MRVEIVQRALKLMLPEGFLWFMKTGDSDTEKTINGFSHEFNRLFSNIETVSKFFLPYITLFLAELETILGLPNENLTTEQRQGRVDGRMKLLFTEKGRLNVYEEVLRTAAFDGAVVRVLGFGESPFDFFDDVKKAFYNQIDYNDDDAIYNDANVSGGAFLLTNGGSLNNFEPPDSAFVTLEENPAYWVSYLVIEGQNGEKLEVPLNRRETFFDSVYNWKPADMHVILNVSFVE